MNILILIKFNQNKWKITFKIPNLIEYINFNLTIYFLKIVRKNNFTKKVLKNLLKIFWRDLMQL